MKETYNQKLNKEKENYKKLLEKKKKIDDQIKSCQKKIKEYENLVLQEEILHTKEVLSDKGMSLDEILVAIKKGDLTELQLKLEE